MANALSSKIEASFLCATRKEGLLKSALKNNVNYLFLNKKSAVDFKALFQLNKFIKQNQVQIIHAHSTSFFMASLAKLLYPEIKIIWHDHYGNSEQLYKRKYRMLRFCSRYFTHIFSVNKVLENWAKQHLKTKHISCLPNFAVQDISKPYTQLHGEKGKRILHLANLRSQKDHQTLLKAFSNILKNHPDWTLHGVGKDFNDAYFLSVKNLITDLNMDKQVFLYGSCTDISNIISQCEIGVLSSKSEGLPIALLEYGLAGLPVVVTDVGDCSEVIKHDKNGQLVQPENIKELTQALQDYIINTSKRKEAGKHLKETVENHFSEKAAMDSLMKIYKKCQP
jgi:glycosyltransferase involved in cell wall biosynthesis